MSVQNKALSMDGWRSSVKDIQAVMDIAKGSDALVEEPSGCIETVATVDGSCWVFGLSTQRPGPS